MNKDREGINGPGDYWPIRLAPVPTNGLEYKYQNIPKLCAKCVGLLRKREKIFKNEQVFNKYKT